MVVGSNVVAIVECVAIFNISFFAGGAVVVVGVVESVVGFVEKVLVERLEFLEGLQQELNQSHVVGLFHHPLFLCATAVEF